MKNYVEGADECIRKLAKLRKNDMRKAVRKGSRAGVKLIAPTAKELAPVRTGTLRRAMKVRALPRSRKWTGTQITSKIEGADAYYMGWVEFGHKTKSGGKVEGQHFLGRAFDQQKSSAGSAFIDGITEVVKGLAQ